MKFNFKSPLTVVLKTNNPKTNQNRMILRSVIIAVLVLILITLIWVYRAALHATYDALIIGASKNELVDLRQAYQDEQASTITAASYIRMGDIFTAHLSAHNSSNRAYKAYLLALIKSPKDLSIYQHLVATARLANDKDKELFFAQVEVNNFSNLSDAYSDLISYYQEEKNIEKVVATMQTAYDNTSNDSLLVLMAETQAKEGNYDQALVLVQKWLDNPKNINNETNYNLVHNLRTEYRLAEKLQIKK